MYSSHKLVYILTSLECIEKCFIYIGEFQSEKDFYSANNQMNFNAAQILLQTIGEESKKIEVDLKGQFQNVPWSNIANLRNRIAHDYRGTDPHIVFDVIKNYLLPLKLAFIEMLAQIDYDLYNLNAALESEHYKNIRYLLKK